MVTEQRDEKGEEREISLMEITHDEYLTQYIKKFLFLKFYRDLNR